MSTLTASQLIEFIPLRDDEGNIYARYSPALNVLVIRHRRREYRWHLGEQAIKADMQPTRQSAKKVVYSTP
jgi:hypothetical protein